MIYITLDLNTRMSSKRRKSSIFSYKSSKSESRFRGRFRGRFKGRFRSKDRSK